MKVAGWFARTGMTLLVLGGIAAAVCYFYLKHLYENLPSSEFGRALIYHANKPTIDGFNVGLAAGAGAAGLGLVLVGLAGVVYAIASVRNSFAWKAATEGAPETRKTGEPLLSNSPMRTGSDATTRLERLKRLLDEGLISQEEFQAKKDEILRSL